MGDWEIGSWENEFDSVKKDTNDSGVEEIEDRALRVFKEKNCIVLEKIKELKLPKDKEQIRFVTMRSFNAITFIDFIANSEIIENAIFVIYSINHEAAKKIVDLIDEKKIGKATILMSNLRNTAYRKKEELTK